MKAIVSSAALGLLLVACASTSTTGEEVMIFDPELRSAHADYAEAMATPRTPMTMTSGATVSSCGEYLAQRDQVDVAPTPDNRIASLEYVICDSLFVLQDALPVADGIVGSDMGQALATRLDLRSFRSSRHQRTTDEAFTLQAVSDHPLDVGAYAAELNSPGWYFKLEVVAVADFDASGRPDWLIWVVDQSLKGTYLTVAPLIVHDPGAHGLLRAMPLQR